jgi:peptide/nickel transport system substrate-binding protein
MSTQVASRIEAQVRQGLHAVGARRAVRRWAAGLAAAVLAVATAPAAGAETVLRARLNADILSTQPGGRRDANTDDVLMHIVEGLVAFREDGTVGPMLARSWTVSPDGRAYTFQLRSGVVFHNGQPLVADDVVWSIHRYLDPKTHWRCAAEFGDQGIARIVGVAAPDPRTVVIRLDRPAPMLLKTLARPDCGGTGVLSRASVGPDGQWRAPVGTGPFMFSAWKHNQYVDVVRFPRYAALPGPRDGDAGGKAALVDRVRFLVIPDSSAARAALLSGSLDVIDQLSPSELGGVRGDKRVRLTSAPTSDFWLLMLQVRDPLLKDVRLRRAIALTIDTAGLTKAITWGMSRPDNSPVPTTSPYFTAAEAPLRRVDIPEARRLAKAAGYHGQPIRLMTNRQNPQMFDSAVLIQAMAAQAGINFTIETVDWANQLEHYGSGDYQAMTHAFSARLDPAMNFTMLIGDKSRDPRKVWDSAGARVLLQKAVESADPAKRQAAFDGLQRDFLAEVPAVVLFNSTRISAVRSNVTGYREWPAAQQRLWGVGLK